MRALFLKELNQGRPLLIFGAVMGVLVPAGQAALARLFLLYEGFYEPEVLAFAFGLALAAMLPLIALLAGSGVFSGEVHGGTLPVLFGLPLSRRRIWASLALAAFALTAIGGLIVLVLGHLLLRSPFLTLALQAHLPDAICSALFLVSVGLFSSSLVRSVTGAIATTILLSGALVGGSLALVLYWGASIFGLPILDIALWCALFSPALLLGSALAVTRGELLTGFRKWIFSVPSALAVLGLTVLVTCGLVRAATRYSRSSVARVHAAGELAGGRFLTVLSQGGAVRLSRSRADLLGMSPVGADTPGEALSQLSGTIDWHVRIHSVVVDVETGEEMYLERAGDPYDVRSRVGCSADGRFVAALGPRPGLTWGPRPGEGDELQIFDTQQKRTIYRGTPDVIKYSSGYRPLWSPSGTYLGLVRDGPESASPSGRVTVHILQGDGSESAVRPIILTSASWAPTEDVIYGFDDAGALCRAYLDGRATEVIWSPEPDSPKAERRFSRGAVSPDGRWIAVTEVLLTDRRTTTVRLVDVENGASQVIWEDPDRQVRAGDVAWSRAGNSLYLLARAVERRAFWVARVATYSLLRWDNASGSLAQLGPEITATHVRLLVRPDAEGVLLWSWQEKPWPLDGRPRPGYPHLEREELLSVDTTGRLRALPVPGGSGDRVRAGREVGFDRQGRLVFLSGDPDAADRLTGEPVYSRLDALDPDTGEITRIYP